MSLKIDHIGYLVKKIDRAAVMFEGLGFKCASQKTHDQIRHIDIVFMEKDGYNIELVSPYDEESVVSGLAKNVKNSPYHICYLSDDFTNDLNKLCQNGFAMIGEPLEAPAFNGKKVVFLVSYIMGMIELLEK